MKKILYSLVASFLLLLPLNFSGCSGGQISPDVICDYANIICENISFFCSSSIRDGLTKEESKQFEDYLRSVVDSLNHYKKMYQIETE